MRPGGEFLRLSKLFFLFPILEIILEAMTVIPIVAAIGNDQEIAEEVKLIITMLLQFEMVLI